MILNGRVSIGNSIFVFSIVGAAEKFTDWFDRKNSLLIHYVTKCNSTENKDYRNSDNKRSLYVRIIIISG